MFSRSQSRNDSSESCRAQQGQSKLVANQIIIIIEILSKKIEILYKKKSYQDIKNPFLISLIQCPRYRPMSSQ